MKRYSMSIIYVSGMKKSEKENRDTNIYYTPKKIYLDVFGNLFKVESIQEKEEWVRPIK